MDELSEALEIFNRADVIEEICDRASFDRGLSLLRSHQEEYEKLKQELEDYYVKDRIKTKEINLLVDENKKLKGENERLREALNNYGVHHINCLTKIFEVCNCGLKQALESEREGE